MKALLPLLLCLMPLASLAQSSGVNGGGNLQVQGSVTNGNCTKFLSATTVADAGAPCGGTFTGVTTTGTPTSGQMAQFSGANTVTGIAVTGTGNAVLATSPALTTPNLGTPSAATLTNATGLPVSTGVSGLGTGVATFLGTPSSANLAAAVTDETGTGVLVFGTSPALTTPNLGTPSAATLTNATGLPISTGVSGLATGVATFLGTPTSANLAAVVTNETGTGALVFATSPTLVTPTLGAATASGLTLSSITGSTQCLHVNTSGVVSGTGSDCGAGGGAVSSVSAGGSGSVSVSPTTGAVVVDLASQATATVISNISGSSAAPVANSLTSFQTAMVAANAQLVTATAPTGPTNDYSPTSFGTTTAVLYLTPTAGGSTINGLLAGSAMQQVFIVNAEAAGGSDTITLVNQSTGSTAANRFQASGNLVLPPGGGVDCVYLASTITRWWCH